MRVAHIITGLGLGGAEVYLRMILCNDQFKTVDNYVYFFRSDRDQQVDALVASGAKVFCLDCSSRFDPRKIFRIRARLLHDRIDVMHAHLPLTALWARVVKLLTGVPLVYTEHNVWSAYHVVTRALNRWTFDVNDVVIAVSQDVADSMINKPMHLEVMPNSIDIKKVELAKRLTSKPNRSLQHILGLQNNTFIVGNVANFRRGKNHSMLIRAFKKFSTGIDNAALVLIGQKFGSNTKLEELAVELGIPDKVFFLYGVDNPICYVEAFDLFAMSSIQEGLPIALLEAMALGIPCISTPVGGIPELIRDGVDGVLCDHDTQSISEIMTYLYQNPEKRRELGSSGRVRVENSFALTDRAAELVAIYEAILK